MWWLGVVAVLSVSNTVQGLLNSTSIIEVQGTDIRVYPCLQINHIERELDPSMMGLWYVVEIVQHRESKQTISDICPKLTLYMSSVTEVKLLWQDKTGDVNFNFKVADKENSGFWLAWGKQTGSMLTKVNEQFGGSVQVIEALPSRLVLTFCSYNRTHYSLIMVRNISVPHDTLTLETRAKLIQYGLPEISVHLTCQDPTNGSSLSTSIPSLILLSAALSVVTRFN